MSGSWAREYREGLQPLVDAISSLPTKRSDVLVLIGHTPNTGREVWVNPYKIESLVEVVTQPSSIGEIRLVNDPEFRDTVWQSFWWWFRGRPIVKASREPATPERRGTQVNMDSGDQGIIRESIKEVTHRIQEAYAYDWTAEKKEDDSKTQE